MRKRLWFVPLLAMCVWLVGCKLQEGELAGPPGEAPAPPGKAEMAPPPAKAEAPAPEVAAVAAAKYHPGGDLTAAAQFLSDAVRLAKEKDYAGVSADIEIVGRILSYLEAHLAPVIVEQGCGTVKTLLDANDFKGAEAEVKRIKIELDGLAGGTTSAMTASLDAIVEAAKAGDAQKAKDEASNVIRGSVDTKTCGMVNQIRQSLALASVATALQRPKTLEAELNNASDAHAELATLLAPTLTSAPEAATGAAGGPTPGPVAPDKAAPAAPSVPSKAGAPGLPAAAPGPRRMR